MVNKKICARQTERYKTDEEYRNKIKEQQSNNIPTDEYNHVLSSKDEDFTDEEHALRLSKLSHFKDLYEKQK